MEWAGRCRGRTVFCSAGHLTADVGGYVAYIYLRRWHAPETTYPAARDLALNEPVSKMSGKARSEFRTEAGHAAFFLVWPAIGFGGAIIGGWSELEWLAPLGIGGLFCHYWLDGRIWTRRGTEIP